jgi:SAM-dependent methyltransferase
VISSIRAATPERWGEAQEAERDFWDTSTYTVELFSATLAALAEAAAWTQRHLGRDLPPGDLVELGIGPLGIGCIHLLPRATDARLVAVDPIAREPAQQWPLPEHLQSVVAAWQGECEQVTGRAERTGLPEGRFGVAVLHNMLDHVQEPAAVLAEAHRLLRPDGVLVLACDTLSLANRARLRLYTRRRFADSLFIRAHPFHFGAGRLLRLVAEARFHVLATNRRSPAPLYETFGHAHRLLLVAEKAGPSR